MKISKKSFAYLISGLLLLLPFSGKTCSYTEYGEDLRISMFRIMTLHMQAYYPFVYTAELYNSCSIVSEKDRKRNIDEWVKQFEKPVRAEDVEVILYKTDPELFYLHAERQTLNKFFEGNTFIEELLKPENKDFYKYMMVAKAIEYKEAQYIDPWEKPDSEQKALSGNLNASIMKQIKKYKKHTKSTFLQQRYAFQHIRMLFQNNDFDGCVRLYNETFTLYDTSTIVAPWALHYSAICKNILGDSTTANYEMSLVFSQCDDKKFRMYMQFDRSPLAIAKTLTLARNNQERATILGISILNNPGRTLPTLQQMVNLDSKNPMLSFLVLREVNKLEDWLLTTGLTLNTPAVRAGFSSYEVTREDYLRVNFDNDMKYLNNVIAIVQQLHQQAYGEEKQFYMLALVHLFTMAENNSAAMAMLNSSNAKMPVEFQRQALIENLILLSSGNSLSNPENRNKAGKIFMSLDSLEQKEQMSCMTLYSLCQRYGQAMFAQNDLMRSILFLNLADDYKSGRWYYNNNWRDNNEQTDEFDYYTLAYMDQAAKPADIDKLIEFINSEKSGSFDTFLAMQAMPSVNQCLDLKGSKLFREGKLKEALTVWEKLPKSWWNNNGSFANYLNIDDLFSPKELLGNTNFEKKQLHFVSKAGILKKIIEMQDSAETASADSYKYKLKLAHAWYSVSYFGNNWILAHYYKSCSTAAEINRFGFEGMPNIVLADSANYIQLENARKLYREVATFAPDAELRCEAMTMLLYTEYLKFLDEYRYDWENERVFKPTYLPAQWKEYENTAFFKSMYISCPRFEEFVSL